MFSTSSSTRFRSGPTALGPSASHPNILAPSTPKMIPTMKSAYDEGMSDSDASVTSPNGSGARRCLCGNTIVGESFYCSASESAFDAPQPCVDNKACARSDAFSSLCYKSNQQQLPPLQYHQNSSNLPSLGSSISCNLSRNPSSSSASTTGSYTASGSDWEASHYRRLNHADLRRQERRQERRRRREEGSITSSASSSISLSRSTMMSTLSTSSSTASVSRVPDLIGGGGMHSRNPSVASSVTSSSSAWSVGGLSRNPSTASTASSRRGYGGVQVGDAIMEDDDEEEWLTGEPAQFKASRMGLRDEVNSSSDLEFRKISHRRRASHSNSNKKKKQYEQFGMGKDMRDVLEEIISMEKEFRIEDSNDEDEDISETAAASQSQCRSQSTQSGPGLFTSTFDRPPRTPSPILERRNSVVPGAPNRGHRRSLSNPISPQITLGHNLVPGHKRQRQRPPSTIFNRTHQSSLSESHTALYLATASPESSTNRKSESPKLKARTSLTFTPEIAGPDMSAVTNLPSLNTNFSFNSNRFGFGLNVESPCSTISITPSRRRPNVTPGGGDARHPTMDNWRFPNVATPTNSNVLNPKGGIGNNVGIETPTRKQTVITTPLASRSQSSESNANANTTSDQAPSAAHLLWPPVPPTNLAPSLFPISPSMSSTSETDSMSQSNIYNHRRSTSRGLSSLNTPSDSVASSVSPPHSGVKLGFLLGSSSGSGRGSISDLDNDDDLEMEVDDDQESTAHGHGHGHGFNQQFAYPGHQDRRGGEYLPVFLQAEGFTARRWGEGRE